MDLGTFYIDTLIVHDVPRRLADGSGESVVLSQVPSALGQELRNFFKERITRTLGSEAFEVERDPDVQSPVPQQIADIITDATKIVPASQEVALHLHASQTGWSPRGLVVVCRGTVDGEPCCAILKLEHEEAIRVQQTRIDGQLTFDVAHLRDLMLGQNTRVFKASLFTTTDGTATGLDGRVSDNQALGGGGVASFFLKKFLGCRLKTSPRVATQAFFEGTQEWINGLEDPVKRGRYEVALIAQMNHQATTVTPTTFAEQHLDAGDRASFRQHLADASAPTGRFAKDTSLIAARIKQMSIRFRQSTVRVSGTPQDVGEYVRINRPGVDRAPVEILDEVDEVRGGR